VVTDQAPPTPIVTPVTVNPATTACRASLQWLAVLDRRLRVAVIGSVIASLASVFALTVAAQTGADFYRGKQIRLIVGGDPGGGADIYGRFLARWIGRFIPGFPSVVVVNDAGAGGMRAANDMTHFGAHDGTEMGITVTGLPLAQAFGQTGVKFDLAKFKWIGDMSQSPNVIIAWSATGVKTIDEARHKELVVGSTSPLSTDGIAPLVANSVIGTRFRVVNGYAGGGAINLAIEHGEVGGRAGITWAELKSQKPYWIVNKSIDVLAQMGMHRIAELPDVPLLVDFAKNEDDRDVLAFVSDVSVVARPVGMPPGVPPERVALLRRAFDAAMRDPAVLADASKERLDISPLNGDETASIIVGVADAKKNVVARVAAAIAK
jgi:tripartite-type tricarboxylate transporter receptor subunit TctC